MKKRITVVGGGAWGTALAVQAVRAGEDVELILRNPDLADRINNNGENDFYLPVSRCQVRFAPQQTMTVFAIQMLCFWLRQHSICVKP